jgi:hypothetical protein
VRTRMRGVVEAGGEKPPAIRLSVTARQRKRSGSQTAAILDSRSLTMKEHSGSRSVTMGSRSLPRARQRTVRLTLADNGEKPSILRLIGRKQASARLWATTSRSVHLLRQGFPTVNPSREAKLTSETLQGFEGLGQVDGFGRAIDHHPSPERFRLLTVLPMDMADFEMRGAEPS